MTSEQIEIIESKPLPQTVVSTPQDKVKMYAEVAGIIKDIILKQRLSVSIQGKEYVKVDAWVGMGSLLGILPRETSVLEHPDGSYEAHVDLIQSSNGCVVGGASAICGVDERRWQNADKYARRSMAITRATGKAYRIAFSWVMCLAGYEPTPAEEMPGFGDSARPVGGRAHQTGYTGTPEQSAYLEALLKKQNYPESLRATVKEKMMGRPSTDLEKVCFEVEVASTFGGTNA